MHSDRVFVHTAPAKKRQLPRVPRARIPDIFNGFLRHDRWAAALALVCANLARTQLRIVVVERAKQGKLTPRIRLFQASHSVTSSLRVKFKRPGRVKCPELQLLIGTQNTSSIHTLFSLRRQICRRQSGLCLLVHFCSFCVASISLSPIGTQAA